MTLALIAPGASPSCLNDADAAVEPIVPAYSFHDGAARIGFYCPHCEAEHMHGDTGVMIERRLCDVPPPCPFAGRGYRLLILGRVRGWRYLPRMTAARFDEAVTLLFARKAASGGMNARLHR